MDHPVRSIGPEAPAPKNERPVETRARRIPVRVTRPEVILAACLAIVLAMILLAAAGAGLALTALVWLLPRLIIVAELMGGVVVGGAIVLGVYLYAVGARAMLYHPETRAEGEEDTPERQGQDNGISWVHGVRAWLVHALILALDLQIAADILRIGLHSLKLHLQDGAIAEAINMPQDIGIMAGLLTLRIVLSFLLHWEIGAAENRARNRVIRHKRRKQ